MCAECSSSGAGGVSASSSVLKATLQAPAMCEGLPAQQAIPHSCDEAEKELGGTTPASSTRVSITASVILAIAHVRNVLTRREAENKRKTPFRPKWRAPSLKTETDSVTGTRRRARIAGKTGDRIQNTGVRSQRKAGVRSQKSGVRRKAKYLKRFSALLFWLLDSGSWILLFS